MLRETEIRMQTMSALQLPTAALRPANARGPLIALSFATILSSIGTSVANVALPTLAVAFDAPFQSVQWVVLAYLLGVTTSIIGIAALADRVGRRRLLLVGILIFATASGFAGIAPTLGLLIAARAAQGIGAATMMALAMAMAGETSAKDRLGAAMGLLGTTSALGTALGPTLGGAIIAAVDWRGIFLLNVPLGALAWQLARRWLPADGSTRRSAAPRFDYAGTVVLALTLAGYALAMTLGRGKFGVTNAMLLVFAAAGVAVFVRLQARAAAPWLGRTLFRDRVLMRSLAMNALISTVMMGTLVIGPFYLTDGLKLNAAAVGLTLSIGPAVAAIVGLPAGRLADRFGTTRITVLGLTSMLAGCLALTMSSPVHGVRGYIIPLSIITAGYALFQAANNAAVMAASSRAIRGTVSGALNLSRNLGLITGASLLAAVFAHAAGTTELSTATPAAVGTALRITFTFATALVATALVLLRPRSN